MPINTTFTSNQILNQFLDAIPLSNATKYRKINELIDSGKIVRFEHNRYKINDDKVKQYSHVYSELSTEIASIISTEEIAKLNFSDIT